MNMDVNKLIADFKKFAKEFDRTYEYSDDSKAFERGRMQHQNLVRLYLDIADHSMDPNVAKDLWKKEFGGKVPSTRSEAMAAFKVKDEKMLKAMLSVIHKFDWKNVQSYKNADPAKYICGIYRGLSSESREVVNKQINTNSGGRYKNHKDFCLNLYSKFLK